MRGVVIFFVVLGVVNARSSMSDNFLKRESKSISPKDNINQWNIVQVGSQPGHQGGEQAISPGFVWVQVPVGNLAVVGNSQTMSQSPKQNTDGNLNNLCLKPTGQFPSKSCNKFVNCWNGVATEQECPDGLVFSQKGYCDYQEHVDCNGKLIEASSTSSPGVSVLPTTIPSSEPASTNNSAESTTTSSLPTTTPTVATLPPVDPSLKKLCLTPRGQFPGTTCKKYVNCWDDIVVEQECPEELLFSSKGYCDYPQNVECKVEGVSKITHECPLESGTFRDKHDCGIFYNCVSHKIAATYVCPDGFKFSKKLGVCDYEERVDCNESSVQKTEFILKNSQESGECSVKYGTFRDVNNCNRYYTCASFKIVAQHDCPSGFSFNDDIGICDYSYNVDCSKNPKIYEITSNSLLQLPAEYRERVNSCKPGSVIRLDSQCTVACLCRQGLAEIVHCPTGYAYDSRTDKCVLSHLARC